MYIFRGNNKVLVILFSDNNVYDILMGVRQESLTFCYIVSSFCFSSFKNDLWDQ